MPIYTAQELEEQGKGPTRFDDLKTFWEAQRLSTVEKLYAELGKPGRVGQGFAITVKCFQEVYGGKVENVLAIPAPDYDHAIFMDVVTDNLLVVRPHADGEYKGCSPDWKRLR